MLDLFQLYFKTIYNVQYPTIWHWFSSLTKQLTTYMDTFAYVNSQCPNRFLHGKFCFLVQKVTRTHLNSQEHKLVVSDIFEQRILFVVLIGWVIFSKSIWNTIDFCNFSYDLRTYLYEVMLLITLGMLEQIYQNINNSPEISS